MVDSSGLLCDQVTLSYPEFTLSLDLAVREGEFVSIIGPSGCGKSTTLQVITGILPCTRGNIYLHGKEISSVPVHKRNIGMVFQDYALFPHINVEKNIAYSLHIKHTPKKEINRVVTTLLDLVGLAGYQKRSITSLSGGERQRVALARALAAKPQLLLLDEPLSALDAKLRKHMREQIKEIHNTTGITTVYVTHDQEEALSMSDRVAIMQEGKIIQCGTPEELYMHPKTLFAAQFMGDGNILQASAIGSIMNTEDTRVLQVFSHAIEIKADLFFRPEQVMIHDDQRKTFFEFLSHLRFARAKVVNKEYQGGRYLVTCVWKQLTIKAYTVFTITAEYVTLSVKLKDVLIFSHGLLIES